MEIGQEKKNHVEKKHSPLTPNGQGSFIYHLPTYIIFSLPSSSHLKHKQPPSYLASLSWIYQSFFIEPETSNGQVQAQ
jgi:hypothetical protein